MGLTQARLHERLTYNEETGELIWRVARGGAVVGKAAGCLGPLGYINLSVDGKSYGAHRIVWMYVHGYLPSAIIDHKNGNKSDNRITNLREATISQNRMNCRTHSNNSSGLKGVRFDKIKKRWEARITIERKQVRIGRFKSAAAAHAAYVAAAVKHYQQFARFT